MPADPVESPRVERTWTNGAGDVYAVQLSFGDGNRADVRTEDGALSWADPDVWAFPERYGLERYYCPGHGGSKICEYGACDEIRYPGQIVLGAIPEDQAEAGS